MKKTNKENIFWGFYNKYKKWVIGIVLVLFLLEIIFAFYIKDLSTPIYLEAIFILTSLEFFIVILFFANIFHGNMLFKTEKELKSIINDYDEFELNEANEKYKYMTASLALTLYTVCIGITYFIMGYNHILMIMFKENIYFKFFIILSIISGVSLSYLFYNHSILIIRKIIYETKTSKKSKNTQNP